MDSNSILEYNNAINYLQQVRDTQFEKTPTWRLFNKRYRVSSKFIETLTIEELRQRPFLETGFEEFDEMFKEEEITRWLTVDEMVELYHRNVGFKVLYHRDLNAIYNDIHDHLCMWCAYLQTDYSAKQVPLSELNMMSDFATVILGHINNRTHRTIRYVDHGLANHNRKRDGNKFFIDAVNEIKIDVSVPYHIPVIEFINKSSKGLFDPCERMV